MHATEFALRIDPGAILKTMRAAVFVEPGRIELQERPVPKPGPGEALVQVTTTTICCVPFAMANLTAVPDGLTDEQVLMCPDTMSTGFEGAESGEIRIGDTVAVFAQGPIGRRPRRPGKRRRPAPTDTPPWRAGASSGRAPPGRWPPR